MKVTNGDIWMAKDALPSLLKEPWPVKTAYDLARLARSLNEHLPVIEQVRVGLVNRYGAKDEAGNTAVTPSSEHWGEFSAAYEELMEQEADVWGQKIVLPASDRIALLPSNLMALDAFIAVAED